MADLILNAGGAVPLTMSSREIADLLECRHDNVKVTIDRLAAKGVIAFPAMQEKPSTGGRPSTEYLVGKRDSYVVVAQLSPEFTARLVDRWQELEAAARGPALPDFADPAAAAMAWAEQYRARQALLASNEQQAQRLALVEPKAQALDRIATPTEGAVCLRVAAKLLQVQEKEFIRELHARNWIFRHHHSGTWQGYAEKSKAGLLELKLTRVERDDGSEKVVEQVLITRRGLARLALILQRPLLDDKPLSAA